VADRLRIRPARADDAAEAAAVLRDSIRALCVADHGDDPDVVAAWCANKTPERVAAWIADPQARLFVADLEGRLAGVAGLKLDGTVTLNYVAPAARFRGVSSALLVRIAAELAAHGLAEARLDSTRTALAFYRARGWQDAGPPHTWAGMPSFPMRKPLG
jgi:GNAT superfamily N-acetyltransferase